MKFWTRDKTFLEFALYLTLSFLGPLTLYLFVNDTEKNIRPDEIEQKLITTYTYYRRMLYFPHTTFPYVKTNLTCGLIVWLHIDIISIAKFKLYQILFNLSLHLLKI